MSFLQPVLFVIIGPLIALPLIIHLLSRKTSKQLFFPSVKHLKVSMTRSAAIYRWRHWLLLLLRTLLLTLLLLAFLLPRLHQNGAIANKANRIVMIVIDNSLSMEYSSGGKRSRERASDEAERIINTLQGGDLVNIYSIGNEVASAFNQPGSDITLARKFIRSLEPGVTQADFSKVNRQLGGIKVSDTTTTEIYYLSDFQRSDWANVDFRPLPTSARTLFVDVGATKRANHAVTDLKISGETVIGGLITVEAEVANYSDTAREELVTLLMDGRPAGAKTIYIAPNSTARTTFPLALPEKGKHLLETQLAEDALPSDDHFYAVLDVKEKEEVLIVTDTSDTTRAGTNYLEAALNPFFGAAGGIKPRRVDASKLTQSDLASVTKLFITNASQIDQVAANHLADFLFSGGGIIWYLDSTQDPINLAQVNTAIGTTEVALQLGDWQETEQLNAAQQVISGDFSSPFLQLFAGTRRQDLSRLEVYDNYTAARNNSGDALLVFSDGSPAMTIQEHGLGQLLLLNFSPNPTFSNLANQRFFPVWMQSIIEAFHSNTQRPAFYNVGERVSTEVWRSDIKASNFHDPKGEVVKADIEIMGTRASVAFVAKAPGVYHLSSQGQLAEAFAVNLPPEEADLRPIDLESLPERQDAPRQATLIHSADSNFEHTARGKPIFHWFIAAALFCAIAELGLQMLIRRHSPKVIPTE